MTGIQIALIRYALVAPIGDVGSESTPPIGLAYLSAIAKNQGASVTGIDASGRNLNKSFKIPKYNLQGNGLELNEIFELIHPETKFIGVTAMFSHEWPYVRDCINATKEKFPNATIVVGGEHATSLPEYNLRDCKGIDYISLGEGEQTWLEIIEKKKNNENFDNIDGLAYLKNGEFVKTKFRERIKHIDEIPWPDWNTFRIESYLDNAVSFGPGSGRNMPIMASRGCPYECTFCSNPLMYGRRYYLRQIDDLIEQIKFYIRKYKITGLQFYDLTAIIRKDWVLEFCKKLKENNISLEWSLPSGTRSEALNQEVLQSLSKANLRYLVYAPESGSVDSLKRIKKKIKLSNMEQSIKYAIKENISVRTNLIIGFPDEKRLDIYKTLYQQIKFSVMGVEDVPTYYFNAYPGTELFDMLVKEGKIIINDEYFLSLATLSHYNLYPTNISYNNSIGRYELYLYRMLGMILSYSLSYLLRPKRILRTIKSLFTGSSETVVEQRLKDLLRRSNFFQKKIRPFVNKYIAK
jgi:anaerobic magnesium-protoporphyrin IX monomethyl ester cyclase